MDVHDYLENIQNHKLNPLQLHKIDAEFKVTIIDFLNEQRALIVDQKKYVKWTFRLSIAITFATVVYAFFAMLQYFKM